MKSKLLYEQNGQKTFVLVFDVGDEVIFGGNYRNFRT